MYLISAYFDQKTNEKIQGFINKIAHKTGNTFMLDHQVPPHLTISAIETKEKETLISCIKGMERKFDLGELQFVSVGSFFPYVLYLTPVLNEYLCRLSKQVYEELGDYDTFKVSRFYQPMQWLPHITLGKKLTKPQLLEAFSIMQEDFVPFQGQVTALGLSKVKPYQEFLKIECESNKGERKWM